MATVSMPGYFNLQLFTDAGLLGDGFRVYTYAAGTTTHKTAYTDDAGTVPHTYTLDGLGGQYIACDARGELPAPLWLTSGSYDIVAKTAAGVTKWTRRAIGGLDAAQTLDTALRADLASVANNAKGPALVGYLKTLDYPAATVGGVLNTLELTPEDFGAVGDNVEDDTVAVQAWVAAIEKDAWTASVGGRLKGKYKVTDTINFTKRFVRIVGSGMLTSAITMSGVAKPIFKVTANALWSPVFEDFSLYGDASTTYGIDVSTIASPNEMYLFSFRNMTILSGDSCIYGQRIFNGVFQNLYGFSSAGHTFRVACGPGVTWLGCYASQTGTGKAGYRLAGLINMVNCNGIDSGDYWGIFGQNTAAIDGFQADFPGYGEDYPVVTLYNCNVEAFCQNTTNASGILIHQALRKFEFQGGSFARSGLSSNLHSYIRIAVSPSNGAPVVLNPGVVFTGGGSLAQANGYVYCDQGSTWIELLGEQWPNTSAYSAAFAGLFPMARRRLVQDVFQSTAHSFHSINPDRLVAKTTYYTTPAALTPVGADQNITVTGYSKVLITPAAAASIITATFSITPGTGENGRNGELVIEATNGNLTIKHTARGGATYSFVMTSGGNVALVAGQIVRFLWSETLNQWQQV